MKAPPARWSPEIPTAGGCDTASMKYAADADVARLDRDWIWKTLSQAHWGRWRERSQLEAQIDASWRVVGIYETDSGAQVGFCRAVSDGVDFAYLADVIIDPAHRGHGLGKLLIRTMVDEGPGAAFRWTLFTADAHGLYRQFGFGDPGERAMVRPSQNA